MPMLRLLTLLGEQLICDANLAVFELVKNAYDADATMCVVTLENPTARMRAAFWSRMTASAWSEETLRNV